MAFKLGRLTVTRGISSEMVVSTKFQRFVMEELVHTIALALLTGKNLFVLGSPGQAKSQAIDLFRAHIRDAKQFEILMSKGIDQEQLFGRLDLASIIPGHVSHSVLEKDKEYREMALYLERLLEDAAKD